MPTKKKWEAYICPKCGQFTADCDDIKWSLQTIELKLQCIECDTQWTEYYAVAYDGYKDKTGEYDCLGHKLKDGEIEEEENIE